MEREHVGREDDGYILLLLLLLFGHSIKMIVVWYIQSFFLKVNISDLQNYNSYKSLLAHFYYQKWIQRTLEAKAAKVVVKDLFSSSSFLYSWKKSATYLNFGQNRVLSSYKVALFFHYPNLIWLYFLSV